MKKRKVRISALAVMLLLVFTMAFTGCGGTDGTGSADTKGLAQEKTSDSADAGVSAFSMDESGEPGELTVEFLDVGQGSSALISQDGEYMLVDGGDRDYSSFVVSYLKQKGITRLSCVVVSHYDADHLNGVVGVLNALECDKVLAPDYEWDTKVYQSFLNVIAEKGIPLEHPAIGDSYTFAGSGFLVVSPASYEYADPNSNSLGIRLSYGENSFLICGDCTQESEEDVLYTKAVDLKSDVFAANHHGSQYSNTEEFLEAVSPKSVVISCGMGNSYGHPNAPVLLSVQKLGADLYRTDLQGTITAVSDGKEITFAQEPCMDYRSGAELSGQDIRENTDKNSEESSDAINPAAQAEDAGEGAGADGSKDSEGEAGTPEQEEKQDAAVREYILNTSTMKFHLPSCSSVKQMEDKNKASTSDTRENIIAQGYEPCKRCNP